MKQPMKTILDRLAIQTSAPLTIEQEIADLQAEYPGIDIRIVHLSADNPEKGEEK